MNYPHAVEFETTRSLANAAAERHAITEKYRAALSGAMLSALSGQGRYVTCVTAIVGDAAIIDRQHVAHALLDAIDLQVCTTELLAVLRESQCPTVLRLRRTLAEKYADLHAEKLAEIALAERVPA